MDFSPKLLLWVVLILAIPSLSLATSIDINGVCQAGGCTPTDLQASSIGVGGTAGPDSLDLMNYMVNGDAYDIDITSYGATYLSGTYIYILMSATYVGTAPSTSNDVIQVDELQDFFNDGPGTWDGTYTEVAPVIVENGATFESNLCYNGGTSTQCVGQIGPLGAGTHNPSLSTNLTGLGGGDYLAADFDLIFTFPEGTSPGTSVILPSSVPEPTLRIPLAMALIAFCGVFIGRRTFLARREA